MGKEDKDYLDSKEATNYLIKYGIMPLHLPSNFENIKKVLEYSEHSEAYKKERIKLIKDLYCKLADSDILRDYSLDIPLVKSGYVPPDVEEETKRIIKEVEQLLNKTRDIDEFHHEGSQWSENNDILSQFKTYLSAVYGIPEAIMYETPKNHSWHH
jgi:hypothetical protein